MSVRVLITGGAGFIGTRLAERFAQTGASVTVFDNFHPQVASIHRINRKRLAEVAVRVVEGDVRDRAALEATIKTANPDLVYHLAAETGTGQSYDLPARYSDVNVTGTASLVEALRAAKPGVRRVILAGSRAIYGEGACINAEGQPAIAVLRKSEDLAAGDFFPKDKDGNRLTPISTCSDWPANPASIYASTKLVQEYILDQGFWGSLTEVGILRLQNVYGPGQALDNPYTGVLSIFARQIAEGKALDIYEDGSIVRDFVFVDDAVSAFYRMGTIETMPKSIIDIGGGKGVTILEVARLMFRVMGADNERLKITGMFRPGDIRHAVADIYRARNELGWEPKHDLETGIKQMIAWGVGTIAPAPDTLVTRPLTANMVVSEGDKQE